MSTHFAEAASLERSYHEAVGWCLQYGIKVYVSGGGAKTLGELRAAIGAHEQMFISQPDLMSSVMREQRQAMHLHHDERLMEISRRLAVQEVELERLEAGRPRLPWWKRLLRLV